MTINRTIFRATMPALVLFAMLASPFTMTSIGAADAPATLPVINTVCPMDGKPIDVTKAKMVLVTFGEGVEAKRCHLAFDSEECCTEFMKDPSKVLKPWFIGPKGGDTRKGAPHGK